MADFKHTQTRSRSNSTTNKTRSMHIALFSANILRIHFANEKLRTGWNRKDTTYHFITWRTLGWIGHDAQPRDGVILWRRLHGLHWILAHRKWTILPLKVRLFLRCTANISTNQSTKNSQEWTKQSSVKAKCWCDDLTQIDNSKLTPWHLWSLNSTKKKCSDSRSQSQTSACSGNQEQGKLVSSLLSPVTVVSLSHRYALRNGN